MKNVQRHIHYFIELTECDKRRAAATKGREAALQWSLRPLCEDMATLRRSWEFHHCTLFAFLQMAEGAAHNMRQSTHQPICPQI